MRLICPNCGAQYEVGDDVIPSAGRDVQCSNCGHTWFEIPGGSEAAEAGIDLPEPATAQQPQPAARSVADPVIAQPELAAFVWQDEDAADDSTESDAETAEDDDADQPPEHASPTDEYEEDGNDNSDIAAAIAAVTVATPQRREIAPEVAEILQEEAAREDERRRANIRATLETQPDLGIDAADPDAQRIEESRRRMARMRGETAPTPGADTTGSRRDLLPDIEEINSTLRATTQRADMADDPPLHGNERRRGFRFGFGTMVLIAVIAAAIYIAEPKIIEAIPATEGVLSAYVNAVDQVRLWLDLKMQQILAQMNPPADSAAN